MLFDLFFLCMLPIFILYFLFLPKTHEDRFFDDIQALRQQEIWWLNRKKWHCIRLKPETTVKRPRTRQGDIRRDNGIILTNFLLDDVFQKCDAFCMDKLYRTRL